MNVERGLSPAEVYDRLFVPALFEQWGPVVAGAAGIRPTHRVLDVACGTGTFACAAAAIVGDGGSVVGLNSSDEMLAVARRKTAAIEWDTGPAESLPFPDESFDAVGSQFGFMFFEDRPAALREMMRVLRPGGAAGGGGVRRAGSFARLRRSRRAASPVVRRDGGPGVSRPLFLRRPGAAAFLRSPGRHRRCSGRASRRHGSVRVIESLVSTERACAWTLGGILDDAQFDRLRQAAGESLEPFRTTDGTVAFVMPALILTASRP